MSTVADAATRALWHDDVAPIEHRPPLPGDTQVDIAIVGGGFSGLWTAFYLAEIDPTARIMVLDKHHCGFGASGRNGGWAIAELAGSFERYAERSSPSEALRLNHELFDAVDEIGRVAEAEGIDCGYAKGGTIRVARNAPQAARQRDEIDHVRSQGFTEADIRLLAADEATKMLGATAVQSGIFFAHTAALHPARLVRGLVDAVERRGVTVHEDTRVDEIGDRAVHTPHGTVRAEVVIRATEAYTRDLAGDRRALLPVYSLMIATEPLPESVFDEIGLGDRPTFADDRHMVIYGQRTDDNRLAFGGRGVPYLWGSRIDEATAHDLRSHELIHETLVDLLPPVAGARITHRWGGVLGIPRNWLPGLDFDPRRGWGTLGGYVGEGVAAANLAGRTMAELIEGRATDRTSLPWVGVEWRRWEPEPLRWLGIRASRRVLAAADAREAKTGRESRLSSTLSRLLRGGR